MKGHDTGVKSLSRENSAAKMDEDRRQTCESAANLWKPQLHWSMFHPCCEKWSSSLVRGQRHVQWPFVDLGKPQEQMCLFLILCCFSSSEAQDAFILLLLPYRALMLWGCSEQIYKTKFSCMGMSLWTQSLCIAKTFMIRFHMKWSRPHVATFSQESEHERVTSVWSETTC